MVRVPSPAAARAPTHRSRPACSGRPYGPEASALAAWMPQLGGCALACALPIADSTAFDHPPCRRRRSSASPSKRCWRKKRAPGLTCGVAVVWPGR